MITLITHTSDGSFYRTLPDGEYIRLWSEDEALEHAEPTIAALRAAAEEMTAAFEAVQAEPALVEELLADPYSEPVWIEGIPISRNYHDPDEPILIASEYLGWSIHLCPSEKYYTPWANSNVRTCPVCSGSGTVPNPDRNDTIHDLTDRLRSKYLPLILRLSGAWINRTSNPFGFLWSLDSPILNLRQRTEPDKTCPACDGLGSNEAFADQIFWEALEDAAGALDGWIESGEADPLDTYFCRALDYPALEERNDDNPN